MIQVLYKCRCMDKEAIGEVPDRPRGSPIEVWMLVLQHTIGMYHAAYSPHCLSENMEYVKIPVDEHADGIGEKPPLAS